MSYTIGQSARLRKTITEADIILFAGISGDANPVHIDEIAARESRFGRRIAHGMLGAGLISAVIGMHLLAQAQFTSTKPWLFAARFTLVIRSRPMPKLKACAMINQSLH